MGEDDSSELPSIEEVRNEMDDLSPAEARRRVIRFIARRDIEENREIYDDLARE